MTRDTMQVLNELIEVSKDGEEGFRLAAHDATDPDLRALFSRKALDCANGAHQLQQQAVALGKEPEHGGSAAGAMHRSWTSLKATLSSRTDLAILEECERGEDVAKRKYRDALDESLSPPLHALLRLHYEGVTRNHDQIRDLRDKMRTAH